HWPCSNTLKWTTTAQTSGFPTMHLLRTKFLSLSKTIALAFFHTSILATTVSFCTAGEKEELAAVKALIAIIENGNAGQAKQAESLFESIPIDSTAKTDCSQCDCLGPHSRKSVLRGVEKHYLSFERPSYCP
ncbi:MAG: hypothetical protein ABL921_31455, partial [Pirellula sp.]